MLDGLYERMIRFDSGDPHRIQHLTKVHAFAAFMGRREGLPAETQLILEAAAIVHDIGIRPAEEKYGRHDGPLQEKEGAPLAKKLLLETGFTQAQADRVSYLVGHHHTYTDIDGMDYQLLVEADFLVNLHEKGDDPVAVRTALDTVFRTGSGRSLAEEMFFGSAREKAGEGEP